MFFHIMKREILDHLMSLRFALEPRNRNIALGFGGINLCQRSDYKQKLTGVFIEQCTWVNDQIRESCQQLNELATRGPIALYKRPSPLVFCAADQEDALPMHIAAEIPSNMWLSGGNSFYRYSIPWRLQYIPDSYQEDSMLPRIGALDWSYIIGLVTSFVAILLTFDAISGERENGTLALVLSNAVSRAGVLAGKFLASFHRHCNADTDWNSAKRVDCEPFGHCVSPRCRLGAYRIDGGFIVYLHRTIYWIRFGDFESYEAFIN